MHLMYCEACSLYTLKKTCSKCETQTRSAHPARFSPDDQYSRQRITLKKRFGLLPTQQPPPETQFLMPLKLRNQCIIDSIPQELLLHIFSELQITDLVRASSVCKKWRKLSTFNSLWVQYCLHKRLIENDNGRFKLTTKAKTIQSAVLKSSPDTDNQFYFSLYQFWVLENRRKPFYERVKWQTEINNQPPFLFEVLTFQKVILYFLSGLILYFYTGNDIQKFYRIQYKISDEYYSYGIEDGPVVWTMLILGPLVCNFFQVLILKPIAIRALYGTNLELEKFYKDGWILAIVVFYNIWAFSSFSNVILFFLFKNKSELHAAWFPWFSDTAKIWWEGYPQIPISFGVKWFYLITLGNEAFSSIYYIHDMMFGNQKVKAKEVLSVTLFFLLLLYSYWAGYCQVACAILVTHNFTDTFLYAYKMICVKNSRNFLLNVLQYIFLVLFVLHYSWVKILNSPKIIYSILMEGPKYGAFTGWYEWLSGATLIFSMELIYMHWIVLIVQVLVRQFR